MARYLLGLSCLLWSCTDGDPIKQKNDHEYFPLQVGYFQIYAVEHTTYTGLDQHTTEEYELKTEIIDSFSNPEGSIIFVIHRSKRSGEGDAWEFIDTWSARVTEFEAIMNEGNTSFIKIAFPAEVHQQWNGNALNSTPEDFYEIDNAGVSYSFGEKNFPDCIVINQEESAPDNQIYKEDREEIYARNIGLISKKNVYLNYCDDSDECLVGQQIIISGSEYYQELKEYGQN